MRIPGILKPEGKYSRLQYILVDISTYIMMIGLVCLAFLHPAWIPVTVIGVLLMIYIDVISTIKRLRDLGKPASDYILTLIPIVSWFMDFSLLYQPGVQERNEEAFRDYKISQYDRRYKHREKPYDGRRDIPPGRTDLKL
jgi:hypothetical protein